MTKNQHREEKQLRQLGQGVATSLTLVLVILLCFFLYQYDNQYTSPCQQPSNGVLDLRQAELDDRSHPYHLQKDWEFYPDVLLTPDDDFSLYHHSLHSLREGHKGLREKQGTYRLTILLPDTPMSYALKLPSTFSTYRLYVNQKLILSEGDKSIKNDPNELFKDQILTIWASGEVQILLNYSDEIGIHNGFSAPPIFGRPLRIYNLADYHHSFLAVSMVLILLTLLLSITLYYQSRQSSNLSVIVLCLSAIAYLSYPLIRSEMLFSTYPWYQLRVLFYFCCHAATHWIYSLHFGWKDRVARFINWYSISAVGLCAAILLAFFFLPQEQGRQFFYGTVWILQWGAIFFGIVLTLRMVISGAPNRLMGAASVTIWAFMLIDQITSDFSPMLSARFPEMGIISFMAISILVEYLDVGAAHRFRILYAQKIAYAEQLLKLEERHYAQLSNQVEDARRIRHDLRQHLRVIRTLLDQGNAEAIASYLEQYAENVQPLLEKPIAFFQVPIADALISHYWSAAQKRGADFQVKGQLQELPQSVYVDFCSILGNLLENALEALDRQVPEQPKWIHVQCGILQKKLILEVQNSNSTPVQQDKNRLQSSKRDEPGTGTLSVSIIAQQHGGFASFSHEENYFSARVFLPLVGMEEKQTKQPVSNEDRPQ